MYDYRKWNRGNPRVSSLLLDTVNPRIPKGRGIREQRELIAEFVKHDKVYGLAKGVAVDGFHPLESLIAFEGGGISVVPEGNRRLAALKLPINAELAPEDSVKRFKSLSANVALNAIAKAPVICSASRELSAPLIIQNHTRQQVERRGGTLRECNHAW